MIVLQIRVGASLVKSSSCWVRVCVFALRHWPAAPAQAGDARRERENIVVRSVASTQTVYTTPRSEPMLGQLQRGAIRNALCVWRECV